MFFFSFVFQQHISTRLFFFKQQLWENKSDPNQVAERKAAWKPSSSGGYHPLELRDFPARYGANYHRVYPLVI